MKDNAELMALVCRIIEEIAPDADTSNLDPDDDMREELDLDSMDFLRLVEGLDKETGVNIPDTEYHQVTSLKGMVAYLLSHQRES